MNDNLDYTPIYISFTVSPPRQVLTTHVVSKLYIYKPSYYDGALLERTLHSQII